MQSWRVLSVIGAALIVSACGKKEAPQAAGPEEKVLHVYNWSDYIAPDTVANFEKETGIKVTYDTYSSNEELESKLMVGKTGFDLVVPSAPFLQRQIGAGIYQKLDKSKLTNYKNLDPDIMNQLAAYDPDNEHAVVYMRGSTGIGYNVDKIKALMPDAPLDSWAMIFDPAVVRRFKSCGVAVLDSSSEMTTLVLAYLGRNPNSQDPNDLEQVEQVLLRFRPFIKYIKSQEYIADLANGEICIAVGYSGDVLQARDRAVENNTGVNVAYVIPKEGTIVSFDSLAIPADAPHPKNAHLFIDYLLRPQVAAANTNTVNYANPVPTSLQFVKESIRNDAGVYPPPLVEAKLFPDLADTEEFTRLETRMWTRFMTGQ
jgi:putrescine transport system substrate-binding protein